MKELHDSFMFWQGQRGVSILSFSEEQLTGRSLLTLNFGVMIVPQASADPGLPSSEMIPVDANHITLVKPARADQLIYVKTDAFIKKCLLEHRSKLQVERAKKESSLDQDQMLDIYLKNVDKMNLYYQNSQGRMPHYQSIIQVVTIDGPDFQMEETTEFQAATTHEQSYLIQKMGTKNQFAFTTMNFKIRMLTDHKFAYLPLTSIAQENSVLLVFLPAIRQDMGTVRYAMSFQIKDDMIDFVNPQKRSGVFQMQVKSSGLVPLIRTTFRISKKAVDKPIQFEDKGNFAGTQVSTSEDESYRTYCWEWRNVIDSRYVGVYLSYQ